MNDKHKRFCEEYIANGCNKTQAYLQVFNCKNEKVANVCVYRVFNRDDVQAYIKELQDKTQDEAILSAKERMKYLTDIVKGNVTETVIKGKDADEFNIEANFNDKIKAIDVLNKMDGQYIEKVEVKNVDTDWFIEE